MQRGKVGSHGLLEPVALLHDEGHEGETCVVVGRGLVAQEPPGLAVQAEPIRQGVPEEVPPEPRGRDPILPRFRGNGRDVNTSITVRECLDSHGERLPVQARYRTALTPTRGPGHPETPYRGASLPITSLGCPYRSPLALTVISAGSSSSVTWMVTRILSIAPNGSVAVTTTE